MIKEKDLLEFGFVKNKEPESVIFPYKKVLADSEEGELLLAITKMYNKPDFVIVTPNGDMLFINGVESLEELKIVEKAITGWESAF